MKKLLIGLLCLVSVACATGGLWQGKAKQEKAVIILVEFKASWDEACTQEWLRCDVTAFADTAVDVAVKAIQANPASWRSASVGVIEDIRSRAMVNDLLGRWAAWLDVARFAIENL